MEETGKPRWTFLLQWATSIFFTSTAQKSPSRFPLKKGENCIIFNGMAPQIEENQTLVVKYSCWEIQITMLMSIFEGIASG